MAELEEQMAAAKMDLKRVNNLRSIDRFNTALLES